MPRLLDSPSAVVGEIAIGLVMMHWRARGFMPWRSRPLADMIYPRILKFDWIGLDFIGMDKIE